MTATPKHEIFLMTVEAALKAYRDGDASLLFSAGTLGALAWFKVNDEPWYLDVLSRLDAGTAREIRRKVWELGKAQPQAEDPVKLVPVGFSSFVKSLGPPTYAVDGLLIAGYCYSFTGPSGHGKTAIALTLALVAGHRAAESFLTTLIAGGCPRGDELHATARAVQLAHGDEGLRAFLRRVQKHVEQGAGDA